MIELLFAFAFWPWALVLALFGCLAFSAAVENTIVAVFALSAYAAIAWFGFGVNPFLWIIENPLKTLLISFAYVAFGVFWSFFKWAQRLSSKKLQAELVEAKRKYNAAQKEDHHSETHEKPFSETYFFPIEAKPLENKSRITSWIALWPFSLLNYFFADFLAKFFERIYDLFAGVYDRITEKYTPQ